MRVNKGLDPFIDAVRINTVLGQQKTRAAMGNEFVGNTDAQNLTALDALLFQKFHNGTAESAHESSLLHSNEEWFLARETCDELFIQGLGKASIHYRSGDVVFCEFFGSF